MTKFTPLTKADVEVRELTAVDLRRFKPPNQVLPPELLKEVSWNNWPLQQQNRMVCLSKQLSGGHLLENEAMDLALGDGLS